MYGNLIFITNIFYIRILLVENHGTFPECLPQDSSTRFRTSSSGNIKMFSKVEHYFIDFSIQFNTISHVFVVLYWWSSRRKESVLYFSSERVGGFINDISLWSPRLLIYLAPHISGRPFV